MKKWLNINFYVQISILIVGVLSIPFATVFALLFAVPFGLWQVVSSLVFGVRIGLLEQKFRIYLTIYWIVLVVTLLCIFLSSDNSFYPREMHDYFIGTSVALSVLLGISFLAFSILVRKNDLKEQDHFSSDILDQM